LGPNRERVWTGVTFGSPSHVRNSVHSTWYQRRHVLDAGEEHHAIATTLFGTDDFDRLFVVHAIDRNVVEETKAVLAFRRIHWLSIPGLIQDLFKWYGVHKRPTALRNTIVSDLFHPLIGFCGLRVQESK
jgi:hypothetical protein